PNARWESKWGEAWSMERLVQIQTQANVLNAACGGTHGMFALSSARNAYLQTGQPLRGVWIEADQKIQRYIQEARQLQNSDGTFSSDYFRGRKLSNDYATRLQTSGHMLEWLMRGVSDAQLKEEWVRRGVAAMAKELIDHRKDTLECGSMYHTVDGLVIYRERTTPKRLDPASAPLAEAKPVLRAAVEAPVPVLQEPEPVAETPTGDDAEVGGVTQDRSQE
ncbi:MAG: hypothetical protein WEH44_02315, partial [Pirellulaceae bacterium]